LLVDRVLEVLSAALGCELALGERGPLVDFAGDGSVLEEILLLSQLAMRSAAKTKTLVAMSKRVTIGNRVGVASALSGSMSIRLSTAPYGLDA
jgi:hypothetical protein